MSAKIHLSLAIWAVAAVAAGSGTSGWKPIPPPRGMLSSKISHDSSHHFKHHPAIAEYRGSLPSSSLLDSPRIGKEPPSPSTAEIFFNSPSHSYKFSSDSSHKAHDHDSLFKKDPPKSYKPLLSSLFDDGKRSPFSYHNFNAYRSRKPPKTTYFDKPDVIYSDFIKHDEHHGSKHPSYLDNEIKPIGGYFGGHDDRGTCSLYKVAFRQDLYFQYIQYKVVVPEMKEFTICLWSKYSNHTNDHPLFSYAVRNQPKAISVWVSTTDRSNYFNMAVNGQTILRLNYPIRLNRWYHSCSSWNGKTGEWQVWVNAERIGRGFHNLLVGHKIPGGGIAITGQEQNQLGGGFIEGPDAPKASGGFLVELVGHKIPGGGIAITGQEQNQLGGGFIEGPDAPKGSGGFLGEVTMVQLYKVALTAGKAFNDHRHHHSFHASTTPEPPPPPTQPPEETSTPEHPFLENGQLKVKIPVFQLAESLRTKGNAEQVLETGLPLTAGSMDLFNNPFTPNFYSGLDGTALTPFMMAFPDHNLFKRNNGKSEDTRSKRNGEKSQGNDGMNADMKVKFIEAPSQIHVEKVKFAEKRTEGDKSSIDQEAEDDEVDIDSRQKREFVTVDEGKMEPEETERDSRRLRRPTRQNYYGVHGVQHRPRRPPAMRKAQDSSKELEGHETSKRQVISNDFGFSQLLQAGSSNKPADEEDDGPVDPIEPAEGEVRRIMGVCTGCEPDPFRKVAVITWRSVPKKIYSGALFLKAKPECRRF